ncbi:Mitogen-activated protein kinase kinase kinase 15 [Orchesella cincta]|uniref:mitogen-activated protein kinase kinase kinase n=1 Tax=Orchesella cincta TaxID=48709 RepID=A0A1D2N3M8_ORCCI|nr:Mitogen-activated protein kinase kinase kinase 15 [Orchesella cincta]
MKKNRTSTTDSVGSKSDNSGNTAIVRESARPKMDVAFVIDLQNPVHLSQRKKAFEDVKNACAMLNANCIHIQFEKLDFGEVNILETMYNADVALIDLSVDVQKNTLFYHLGVRESFGMKQNILTFNDFDIEITMPLKLSCTAYPFVTYRVLECGTCVVTMPNIISPAEESVMESRTPLGQKIKRLLQDVEIQSKAHIKEKFLSDLRKARETLTDKELSKALHAMKKRLDDPNVISGETVYNMLLSFREIQDYDAMVNLVDTLEFLKSIHNYKNCVNTPAIMYLYAFALNRRNKEGDREKALLVMIKTLEKKENHVPDLVCLCGRIYKDKFVESGYTDRDSLHHAIHWYRKGFEVQPNEYAGINLATLLVVDGNEFSECEELQHIGMVLNNLIGKKGSLSSLQDYWDVATFFEISVLAKNYGKAIQAAECMFKLKPPNWYLKSTIGNITLIKQFRKQDAQEQPEETIFHFWIEYFVEATKSEIGDTIRIPILIFEPSRVFMPSYVICNLGAEQKSLQIANLCLQCLQSKCKQRHNWLFTADMIKSVSLYKRDDRCVFFYVHENSDDFHMYFPNSHYREHFYNLVLKLTADQNNRFTDLDAALSEEQIRYEYEFDEQTKKVVLGKGTYGTVYAARDLSTQVRIAVKEIPEKNLGEVQPLHEEIRLHSQLRHRNIVQYLGSVSEDSYFKILMEQVPGGSLSALLRSKWGPLKGSEPTIAYYTKQILEGLKYLHDQKIVHRDIKGDNVLVNTYSGVVKISDFGTSKRLAGISPLTKTFAGTLQYMAPEVIDKGQRGYGAPADIWSLGCTIVEMATGKPPFIELGSPEAAMFKVGFYKMHPQIPSEMSERAKKFILKCFEPDPDKRATAAELLEDPFLTESGRKKNIRATATQEFARSISVPADRVIAAEKAKRQALSSDDSCGTNTAQSDYEDSLSRRGSSGNIPVSPESEISKSSPIVGDGADQDCFYLLKKESQRRTTLSKVLAQDEKRICEIWVKNYERDVEIALLKKDHIARLMHGLQDYIEKNDRIKLEGAINALKEEFNCDGVAVNQIQLALFLFRDAVNNVLRSHNIKPHWMFALDSLVSTAIQFAIHILSPDHSRDTREGAGSGSDGIGSTSGVSTVNSLKSHKALDYPSSKMHSEYQEQLESCRLENERLMQELLESRKAYQLLLRSSIDEQKLNLHLLNQTTQQMRMIGQFLTLTPPTIMRSSETGFSSHHTLNSEDDTSSQAGVAEMPDAASSVVTSGDNSNSSCCHHQLIAPSAPLPLNIRDPKLVEFLTELHLDRISIERFLQEEYTYDDVVLLMTREDLKSLKLKGGIELRVWKAIMKQRRILDPEWCKAEYSTDL